jgi:hypothetical protein
MDILSQKKIDKYGDNIDFEISFRLYRKKVNKSLKKIFN